MSVYGSRRDLFQAPPPQPAPPQPAPPPPPSTSSPPSLSYDAQLHRKRTDMGMGFTIFALVGFIALTVYIMVRASTADPIKDIVEDSGDTSTTFNSLTVEGSTTLGDRSTDDLTVNAEVSTSVVPATDGEYSLGSSEHKWEELHTDNVYYSSGTSVVSDPVKVTDGFGYQAKVRRIQSGTSMNLTRDQSGYLFVVEDDPSKTYGQVKLPAATGSGVYYDFLCGTNVGISGSPAFTVLAESDNIYGSMAVVVQNSGGGDGEYETIFTSVTDANEVTTGPSYPISYEETGERGILSGSEFRVTDYDDGVWLVDGTMIVASGLSVGVMNSPIR